MYSTYDVKPSAIETAAYVLLTHVKKGDMTSGRPIAKWMISQINGKGGFLSTQVILYKTLINTSEYFKSSTAKFWEKR